MRIKIITLLFFLFIISPNSQAFLTDSDPDNFFELIDRAPWVMVVKLEQTEAPTAKNHYFVHHLKIQKLLFGTEILGDVKVLQEFLFANEKGAFPSGQEVLTFLAPLPNYTAYAEAKGNGVQFRLLSGKGAVIPNTSEVSQLAREMLSARQESGEAAMQKKKAVYLKGFQASDPRFKNDAAQALNSLDFPKGFFTQEDVSQIVSAIGDAQVLSKSKIALVGALQKSGNAVSIEGLQKIANVPAVAQKWAAIRSLEALGIKRSTRQLIDDFSQANLEEKSKALALIVKQQDEESNSFLTQLLTGPESLSIKRDALAAMGRVGGPVNEKILLEQLNQKDENIATQAILALGNMKSQQAMPKIISLLDSPSEKLRSAAIIAIQASGDSRAMQILVEKYPDLGSGHTD